MPFDHGLGDFLLGALFGALTAAGVESGGFP